jgi:hypothetical protein
MAAGRELNRMTAPRVSAEAIRRMTNPETSADGGVRMKNMKKSRSSPTGCPPSP